MKKLVSLLLCIALLCVSLPALADLNAAFEAGNLKLTETDSVYTPAVSDFELTDNMLAVLSELAPEMDIPATLKDALSGGPPTVLSLAPSGNAAILELAGYGICCSGGKYHIIYPGATRGVEDVYGNRKKYFTMFAGQYHKISDEYSGFIWSPDGRYAAVNNVNLLFMNREGRIVDPMVVDVSTGEMILFDTTTPDRTAGSFVSSACFSRDGRYYYYVLYGGHEDVRTYLCRCELATGETEICLKTDEKAYMPPMYELADGSLLVNDSNKSKLNQFGTIYHFMDQGGEWILEHIEETTTVRYASPYMLFYSAQSGYAVTLDSTLLSVPYSFRVYRPGENFAGFDRCFCLSEEKDEVVSMTGAEFEATVKTAQEHDPEAEPKSRSLIFGSLPCRGIEHAALSPDGNYLLAVTSITREPTDIASRELCLIRLSDLAVRRVDGLEARSVSIGYFDYRKCIEWNTDTLVIATEDGIKTYQFE